jgi:hypothetical protein
MRVIWAGFWRFNTLMNRNLRYSKILFKERQIPKKMQENLPKTRFRRWHEFQPVDRQNCAPTTKTRRSSAPQIG